VRSAFVCSHTVPYRTYAPYLRTVPSVWDVRKFNLGPVANFTGLSNLFSTTDCIFSPAGTRLLTGVSTKKREGNGYISMYDTSTFEKLSDIGTVLASSLASQSRQRSSLTPSARTCAEVSEGSVVRILWHPTLNQIVVGSSDASVYVFYDPEISFRGVKMSLAKHSKKREDDYEIQRPVFAPTSHKDMPVSSRRQKERARKDPVLSRKPDLPVQGPGYNGRIGSSAQQHLVKGLVKLTRLCMYNVLPRAMLTRARAAHLLLVFVAEDPREAILRHAKEAEGTQAESRCRHSCRRSLVPLPHY